MSDPAVVNDLGTGHLFDKPHRLHPACIIINFGVYLVATIKNMAVPIGGILISGRQEAGDHMGIITGCIIAAIGAFSLVGPLLHFFSTTFYIENDALIISSGFVWRKRRTIPLARIQNVNVERTLWHRVLGAAAVKVETAAGAKSEGDLTALSVENANKLQHVLLNRRAETTTDAMGEPIAKPQPLYELSPRQVILAGALGNRAIYIMGSVMAVIQFEGSKQYLKPLVRYMEHLGPAAAIMVSALSFVSLVFIGWMLSIIISATRYYGFRIEKHEKGLLLTHGLITQFKSIIPVGRIQDIRIVEPILFRMLGYCEIYADTAGSFDRKDVAAANKICPILPEQGVSRIGKLLLPEFEFENLSWRMVSKKTIGRHAWRHMVFYFLVLIAPLAYWAHWWALVIVPPLAIYSYITGVVSYRYVGYSWTDDILVARRGVFRKQAVMIPFDRIQHYTITSTWFQRRLGLSTLTAMSGSSGGHPVGVMDIEQSNADALSQTIGASITKHLGSRRGGL